MLAATLAAVGSDEHAQLLALAIVIGATAGAAVLVFDTSIDLIQALVLRGALRGSLPSAPLIPAFLASGLVACRGDYGLILPLMLTSVIA